MFIFKYYTSLHIVNLHLNKQSDTIDNNTIYDFIKSTKTIVSYFNFEKKSMVLSFIIFRFFQ